MHSNSNQLAVFERVDAAGDDAVAGIDAARDFNPLLDDGAGGDAAHRDVLVRADDRDVTSGHRRCRQPDLRRLVHLGVGALALQERNAGAHLRQQAVAGIDDLHLHLHRRFGAVGGGDDLAQHALPLLIREGVDADFRGLPFVQLADARFVHVGHDFERVEIDERADRAGRQRAADLSHHHRRDHLADFRVLRGDRPRERRADDHVLHVDFDLLDARSRAFELRFGVVELRARGHAVLPHRGLPFPLAVGLLERGVRLVELRLHVRALEHRQHLAGGDFVADGEVEADHFPRNLRRDFRLPVGDEIAGRGQQRRVGDVDRSA